MKFMAREAARLTQNDIMAPSTDGTMLESMSGMNEKKTCMALRVAGSRGREQQGGRAGGRAFKPLTQGSRGSLGSVAQRERSCGGLWANAWLQDMCERPATAHSRQAMET